MWGCCIFAFLQHRLIIVFLFSLFTFEIVFANDSLSKKQVQIRKGILIGGTGLLAGGSLIYLHNAWYSDYNTGEFHFFDDNAEWYQVDKLGHVFSTYQTGRLMMQAFDWAGYGKKQKLWIAGGMGLYYMTVVECMDGFSEGWGFSWGDQIANVLGAGLAISQEAIWKEQRVQLKFFYRPSNLAQYNPGLLGDDASKRILKDYNGQSYWLSTNPSSFMKSSTVFPKWLNIAIGYGAYGMIGATANPIVKDENGNEIDVPRYRRFYLSLDVDLTRMPVKSKFLKSLFSVVNIIKFPAPTIEYSQNKFSFHPFYP